MGWAAARLADRAGRPTVAAERRLLALEARLRRTGLVHVAGATRRLDRVGDELGRAAFGALEREGHRLDVADATVNAADPDRVKARGFAIMRDVSGRVVATVAALSPGDAVEVEVADGRVGATVDRIQGDIAPPRALGGESSRIASQNESH